MCCTAVPILQRLLLAYPCRLVGPHTVAQEALPRRLDNNEPNHGPTAVHVVPL
jgi:hypothetical protein